MKSKRNIITRSDITMVYAGHPGYMPNRRTATIWVQCLCGVSLRYFDIAFHARKINRKVHIV